MKSVRSTSRLIDRRFSSVPRNTQEDGCVAEFPSGPNPDCGSISFAPALQTPLALVNIGIAARVVPNGHRIVKKRSCCAYPSPNTICVVLHEKIIAATIPCVSTVGVIVWDLCTFEAAAISTFTGLIFRVPTPWHRWSSGDCDHFATHWYRYWSSDYDGFLT